MQIHIPKPSSKSRLKKRTPMQTQLTTTTVLGSSCAIDEPCADAPATALNVLGPSCADAPCAPSTPSTSTWERDTLAGLAHAAIQARQLLESIHLPELPVEDIADYGQLIQSVVRLSECAMKCERHRLDMAAALEERARLKSGQSVPRGLSPETLALIQRELNLL